MPPEQLTHVWSQALQRLEHDLPRPSYELLGSSKALGLYDNLMLVSVPNEFIRNYMESKLSARIRQNLSEVLQRDVAVEFVTPESGETGHQAAGSAGETVAGFPTPGPVQRETAATIEVEEMQPADAIDTISLDFERPLLNPKYTFDTFVVGGNNRMAHAASLAVAQAPARAYNPLFIYGGVGLGKTHLMQAIARTILERDPQMRVVYVSTETFTSELINAIRDRRQVEFKNRYRNVDVLLVDDVQFIKGSELTQVEFFHTFNALYEADRQLILSSDRPPKEIALLEERLRSRFEWGLIADIQTPDLETRVAILRKKAQIDRLNVPDDVHLFIAERIVSNIRELEGALIRLVAYASMRKCQIDLDFAQEVLSEILPQTPARAITVHRIQEMVAEYYLLEVKDFKIRKRTRQIAFARQVAMYLCRELTDLSLPRVGEEFGGRDHTTVMHAHDKISHQLKTDPELRETMQHLRKRITG